jgi:hypothetical protein
MRAILRGTAVLLAGVVWLAPAPAFAQSTTTSAPAPTTNTPATDTIGPIELKNFSLKGTVTRPAGQPVAPTAAGSQTALTRAPAVTTSAARSPESRTVARATRAARAAVPLKVAPPPATSSGPVSAPPATVSPPIETAPVPVAPSLTPAPVPTQPDRSAPFPPLPVWPWIAAALALTLGAGFLLWRRWPREMTISGPQFDLLVPTAPEPQPEPRPLPRAPAPAPSPSPPPARPAAASGIVASRLRPALELGFQPLRCHVGDDQVAIEFELELFNAGAAPARAVLAEASLLNAGSTQEQDLAVFFANPNGVGERLALIPPMKRISFRSQVVAPRAAIQEYELAGRKAFVPVIAFNALYEWSGGKGQSSAAYLVGRDTQKEKLGPLRLDRGAREFRGLGARPLPTAVRI